MSEAEIRELERKIREGDEASWEALDAALVRAGLPPRRVWHVFSSTGEYADKTETTWPPFFVAKADAVAFMERMAVDRDWEEWVRSDDPLVFRPRENRVAGIMRVERTEVVPSGSQALGRCGLRHSDPDHGSSGGLAECDLRAGHA